MLNNFIWLTQQYLMSSDSHLRQRLTIHNFAAPFAKTETTNVFDIGKKHKPSLQSNYQSEKRIICAQATNRHPRQRWSEQLERVSQNPQQFSSFPSVRLKSKALDGKGQWRLHSFSSRKLNVNAYHKIEQSISKKYSVKMETLVSLRLQPKKIFTISNLKGDLPQMKVAQRERNDKLQRYVVEKHHIDRLKDQFLIPLQLQTQRCRQQEYDDRQLSLQLKNIIRFQFDTQMTFHKVKKPKQEQQTVIDGWGIDRSTLRPAGHLQL